MDRLRILDFGLRIGRAKRRGQSAKREKRIEQSEKVRKKEVGMMGWWEGEKERR
jgi:hypothetical protein